MAIETSKAAEPLVMHADEVQLWADHPLTKKVVHEIINMAEHLKNYLAQGATISKDADVSTDRIVGRIEGLTEIFNLFNNAEEELKEKPEYGH